MLTLVLGSIALGVGLLWLARSRLPTQLVSGTRGLVRRSRRRELMPSRTVALLATTSGATMLALLGRRARARRRGGIEVERTITIRRSPDDLFRILRQPETFQRMMDGVANVQPIGKTSAHWTIPLGRHPLDWEMSLVEERPPELLHWKSVEGAKVSSESWVRFRQGPGAWGTEVSLRLRLSPGAVLLRIAANLFGEKVPGLIASRALHRLKSLVETGEMPTIHGQPAARDSGRDI